MQLIVRYGERPIELDGVIYTIGDVIIDTLREDEIAAPRPVYQTIIDEFKRDIVKTRASKRSISISSIPTVKSVKWR